MLLTAASASATAVTNTHAYKLGFHAGCLAGYSNGHSDGVTDCLEYGKTGVLKEIPKPQIKNNWSKNYVKGFIDGFNNKYVTGYNNGRYGCLNKK